MKIFTLPVLLAIAVLAVPTYAQSQQKEEPANRLIEFHMALLKRGPKWTTESVNVWQQHATYAQSQLESEQPVLAGLVKDDNELAAVYIFRAKSAEEAKSWAMNDPAVIAGHLVAEMHPWWSEDIMKKTSTPAKMTTAYLAFLVRGDKWTPEKTPETGAIQAAHLGNIRKLAAMKKLVIAGPFGDNGRLRGIFVFRVDSLEEAKNLASTDPAVQAGRLALVIHPWVVPEGILP